MLSNSTLATASLVLTCSELLLYIHPISWYWHVDLLKSITHSEWWGLLQFTKYFRLFFHPFQHYLFSLKQKWVWCILFSFYLLHYTLFDRMWLVYMMSCWCCVDSLTTWGERRGTQSRDTDRHATVLLYYSTTAVPQYYSTSAVPQCHSTTALLQ